MASQSELTYDYPEDGTIGNVSEEDVLALIRQWEIEGYGEFLAAQVRRWKAQSTQQLLKRYCRQSQAPPPLLESSGPNTGPQHRPSVSGGSRDVWSRGR